MKSRLGLEALELRLVLIGLLAVCLLAGILLAGEHDAYFTMLCVAGGTGLVFGFAQGQRDRQLRDDAFVLHRPVTQMRLHVERTMFGLVTCAGMVALGCAALMALPYHDRWRQVQWAMGQSSGWDDRYFSLAVAFVAVGLAVQTWAAARLGACARNITASALLGVLLPVAAAFTLLRQETGIGLTLAVVTVTTLAAATTVASLVPRARRVWRGLCAVVVVALVLEIVVWIRPSLHDEHFDPLPTPGLSSDGSPRLLRHTLWLEGEGYRRETVVMDEDRKEVSRTLDGGNHGLAVVVDNNLGSDQFATMRGLGDDWDVLAYTSFWPRWWEQAAARALERAQPEDDYTRMASRRLWWRFEDGLFVARTLQASHVAAVVGLDGLKEGQPSAVRRFPTGLVGIASSRHYERSTGYWLALLDAAAGRLLLFEIAPETSEDENRAAAQTVVRVREVAVQGEGLRRIHDPGRRVWLHRSVSREHHPSRRLVALRDSDEAIFVDLDVGEVARSPLPHDGAEVAAARTPDTVVSFPAPIAAFGGRARIHHLQRDDTVLTGEVTVRPEELLERLRAVPLGLTSLVRPPLFNAASFVMPAPRTYRSFHHRWVRGAVIAGGQGLWWLIASLVIGALCALRARTTARVRCRSRGEVRSWTMFAALLGPAALIWQALALPRRHVEPCACGRPRAVDVPVCLECGAGWLGPTRTGIEVFDAHDQDNFRSENERKETCPTA